MVRLLRSSILCCVAVVALAAGSAWAADWTQFRGPGGLATADDKTLPTKWDSEANVAWKVALPGPGTSSPIVVGDKIFITCYTGYGVDPQAPGSQGDLVYHLLCLKRSDGSTVWDKTLTLDAKVPSYGNMQALHGYASATPAADSDTVYTLFANGEVTAWGFDGSQKWTKNLGFRIHGWGAGASPVVADGTVLALESIRGGALVGLDKKTGNEVWRQAGIEEAWDTPLILKVGNRTEAIVSSKGVIQAFDPAKGTPLWNAKGIDDYICSSVVAADGIVYAIGARRNAAMAVRAGGDGDVTDKNVLWRLDKGSNVSSPVFSGGYLFWPHESGRAVFCVDVKTGQLAYESPLQPKPALIYASPIVGAGNVYILDRAGTMYVVAAKPQFELVSVNKIEGDGSTFNASPVASNGQLLLRSDKSLYCIGKK